jgi:hypothetical protein
MHHIAVERPDLRNERAAAYAQQQYRAKEGGSGYQHEYDTDQFGRAGKVSKPLTHTDLVEFVDEHGHAR